MTCQKSHVRLMRVPRCGFSSRKSLLSSLYDRYAHGTRRPTGCSLLNTRSSVHWSSTLDVSSSTRVDGVTRFMPQALPRRRDVASLITNSSRIGGHTHTEEAYSAAPIEVSVDMPGWPDSGGTGSAGCGHSVNFALKQISSII